MSAGNRGKERGAERHRVVIAHELNGAVCGVRVGLQPVWVFTATSTDHDPREGNAMRSQCFNDMTRPLGQRLKGREVTAR